MRTKGGVVACSLPPSLFTHVWWPYRIIVCTPRFAPLPHLLS